MMKGSGGNSRTAVKGGAMSLYRLRVNVTPAAT